MKKIVKIIKSNILGFIIGAVIFSSIGVVYAALAANSVTYSNTTSGSTATTVQGALDDLYGKTKKLKIGDYISLTPASTSYTIPASETGYSEDQTIEPSELNLWRVIKIDGTGIDVVSEYVSSKEIYFGTRQSSSTTPATETNPNVIAYAKFIKTLNTIAAQYTDNNLVIATRHIGYDKNYATEEITTTTSLISLLPWSSSTGKSGLTREDYGGGDLGYLTDTNLVQNALRTLSAKNQLGAASSTRTNTKYWLASRYYEYDRSSLWFVNLRYIYTTGSENDVQLYAYNSSSFNFNSPHYAIRPILTLKSTTKIVSGAGTAASPYVLG